MIHLSRCGWETKANEPQNDESQTIGLGEKNILLHIGGHLPHSPKAGLEMSIKQIKLSF